jgi:glycosyltransferase involved in cell wall biosynthesis
VQLLGLRRDVPLLLDAADVYVSSAHWEGMPVATLEAMASGLPIVATRVGDVERLVEPDMGTLVEPGDPKAIAEALLPYFADPALCQRQGDAGRAHVRAHFGHDAWAARLLSLYRELVPPGPRRDALGPEEHRCAS